LRDGLAYSVYDISDKLRESGWQVPAYTMPEGAEDIAVLRVVIREGFSRDLASQLLIAIRNAVTHFANDAKGKVRSGKKAFAH
jgi:glutamate decarboxylase